MLRKASQLFLSRLRLSKPWRYKAPFLISIPYFMVYAGHISPRQAAVGFAMSCATIFGIAGFGYFLNDWTDREEDAAAGKFNVMLELPKLAVVGLLLLFLTLAVVPWAIYFPKGISTLGLLSFEFLLFILYSAPPFRFKERGWLGVLCDAGYAHAVPAVLAGVTFFYLGDRSFADVWPFLAVLGAWQSAVGIRNILLHMQGDLQKDTATGTKTLGVRLGEERLARILTRWVIPGERLTGAGFIAWMAWELWPFSIWLLLFPIHLFFTYRLINNQSFPAKLPRRLTIFHDNLYVLWLPMVPLVALAASNAWFLLLLMAHLLIFRNLLRETLRAMQSWNHRQRIKYGFLAAFVFLLAQFQAVQIRGEFFPAFELPMFKMVPPAKGPMVVQTPLITLQSKVDRSITPAQLLPDLAESHRSTILRRNMGPKLEQQNQSDEWKYWLYQYFHGDRKALTVEWVTRQWSPGISLGAVKATPGDTAVYGIYFAEPFFKVSEYERAHP